MNYTYNIVASHKKEDNQQKVIALLRFSFNTDWEALSHINSEDVLILIKEILSSVDKSLYKSKLVLELYCGKRLVYTTTSTFSKLN